MRIEPALRPADVRASALLLGAFVALHSVLAFVTPPGSAELARADPIVQTLVAIGGRWSLVLLPATIVLAVVGAGTSWTKARIDRAVLRRTVWLAGLGAVAAAAACGGLRLAFGDALPAFIPPEESAKPGLWYGLGAGIVEEAVFRVALLPAVFALLARRVSAPVAMIGAAFLIGVLFAAAHELPPAGGALAVRHVLTRILVPGAVMSVLFFWPGPAFLVSAHCTAHLLIPALFR